MKAKRKIDKKAIQQFLIDHTEKIVIGLVGLVFLYFTYSAVMLQVNDSFKQDPKVLEKAVAEAQATINAGPKNPTFDPIPPYAERIEKFKLPLDASSYPMQRPLTADVAPRLKLRHTPKIVAVEELRAIPGRSALLGKEGTAATVGQRWVVLTGLVPLGKQTAEFHRHFDGAVDESNMTPTYLGFIVQRTELASGATAEPNWTAASTTSVFCNDVTFKNQMGKWGGDAGEVVDKQFVLPSVTSPLPSLGVGGWDDEVAHPSAIKLVPKEEREQTLGPAVGPGGLVPGGVGGAAVRGHGIRPEQPPAAGGRGVIVPIAGGQPQPVANNAIGQNAQQAPDYYLLRYFDFDVEPGKRYVYRVVPLLANPNNDLKENTLDDPVQGKLPYLHITISKDPEATGKLTDWQLSATAATSWSKPCLAPKLPGDLRLLAGPAEPPKSPAPVEVTGAVRILRWDDQSGLNSYCVKDGLFRGARLSFPDADMITPGVQQRTTLPRLDTGCVLVDLAGGEALSPRDRDQVHSPGMMLVLDENGNLVLHDEMSETKEWIAATKEPERERPPTGGGRREVAPPPRQGRDSPMPDFPPRGRGR